MLKRIIWVRVLPPRLNHSGFGTYRNSIGAILRLNLHSRRNALPVVKGSYVLTDRDGEKLYVGKADGLEGIWRR